MYDMYICMYALCVCRYEKIGAINTLLFVYRLCRFFKSDIRVDVSDDKRTLHVVCMYVCMYVCIYVCM